MEKTMERMLEMLTNGERKCAVESGVKVELGENTVNGVNALCIPARDAYAYRLQLLDVFFKKEELSKSLLFKSKKSEKLGLDTEHVAKLMAFVDKRYDDRDLKTFTAKANQKCRDTKVNQPLHTL